MGISFTPLYRFEVEDREDFKVDYVVKMNREYHSFDQGSSSNELLVSAYGIFFLAEDYDFIFVDDVINDIEDEVWDGLYDACVERHEEFQDRTEDYLDEVDEY